MNTDTFVGRTRELGYLEDAYQRRASTFVPIYGRRRVGKTALIAEFLREKRVRLYYSGLQLPREQQLAAFMRAAAEALSAPLLAKVTVGWKEALELVTQAAGDRVKLILVLDEYQWIAQTSPELTSVLQEKWDHQWQHDDKMMLLLCGSYIGFMERDVLGHKSPLFGRRTGSILLRPLRAAAARLLHPGMSLEDAARTYFICGGVPAYHLAFSSKRSIAQNIAEAFFEPGPLSREPSFLLREELREVSNYYGVLTALARGLTERKALASEVALPAPNVSFYLEQLIGLGYVRKRYPLSGARPAKRAVRYALGDPLLRFWFRFVEEAERQAALSGAHRAVEAQIAPKLDSYWGYCFEELCRDTLPDLYLLEGVTSSFDVGEFWSKTTQIDVVGVREDGVIDIGECKWGTVPSGASLAEELERKARHLPNPEAATLVRRAFLRRAKRGKALDHIHVHTLADLYAAQEAVAATRA